MVLVKIDLDLLICGNISKNKQNNQELKVEKNKSKTGNKLVVSTLEKKHQEK